MLSYKPLQERAYERLREMIYSRELKFGVIYSETRLAAQMSISRTPIRDALNQLNRERYIDILPNRGFQLHSPDENDIREAYHARMMIECYCGERLARDHQTENAKKTFDKMQESLDHQAALLDHGRSVDLNRFWHEDQEFHFAPLKYLDISAFNLQYDTFLHIFMPQHLKSHYIQGRSQSTIAEHQDIIQCMRAGDVQKTREAIERHLNTTLRLAQCSKAPVLTARVLTDNTPGDGLPGEWGLSIHIEYKGHKYLLDTGETDLFLQNARKLGIPIEDVDYGILSHAHYDHSDGMPAFFEANQKASFFLREEAKLKCYDRSAGAPRYIGIRDGILEDNRNRILYLQHDVELEPGVHLAGHHTAGLEAQGRRMSMYILKDNEWEPDAFAHEQSLVFETDEGLVVFSSCSHAGADNILREVSKLFPGQGIRAIVGGLHLFVRRPEEVRALAHKLRKAGVQKIITGHCTGEAAFAILKDELGDAVEALYCGKTMEF